MLVAPVCTRSITNTSASPSAWPPAKERQVRLQTASQDNSPKAMGTSTNSRQAGETSEACVSTTNTLCQFRNRTQSAVAYGVLENVLSAVVAARSHDSASRNARAIRERRHVVAAVSLAAAAPAALTRRVTANPSDRSLTRCLRFNSTVRSHLEGRTVESAPGALLVSDEMLPYGLRNEHARRVNDGHSVNCSRGIDENIVTGTVQHFANVNDSESSADDC